MNEQWKTVRGHKDYEVSDMGSVRNVRTGKILKPYNDQRGYLRVDLYAKCHNKACRVRAKVHRLVALAFCGPRRGRPVVNHKNRDRHDNRACNLEWVTYAENTAHWLAIENAKLAEMRARDVANGDALPY